MFFQDYVLTPTKTKIINSYYFYYLQNGNKNYTCECNLGFFGRNCETAASTCTENPCHNGGTCVDGPSGYLCVCTPAFEGLQCDVQKDICDPNPCKNGKFCDLILIY